MFASSEAALKCHYVIDYPTAQRELRRHGMECEVVHDDAGRVLPSVIRAFNPLDMADCTIIERTPAAILAWLGY